MVTESHQCCDTDHAADSGRRAWLKSQLGMGAAALAAGALAAPGTVSAASLSQAERDAMTPDDIIAMLKEGNLRFRNGSLRSQDFLEQKRATVSGQYPAAVILSCIDSRAPAEIILDTGIGDAFGARIAGNIVTPELLGSMEYACAVAGAKLALVMGHTNCGAIAGAIDRVQLGNLTGLLEQIKPVVEATEYTGERTGRNREFVNAVARSNVVHTMAHIRRASPILADLERQGKIKIAGAMYDLSNGHVRFFE